MLREALSTARPRCRPRSESTPHDNLTATTPKSRSPVRSLLSRPQWGALQCCVHHTTTTPIFPHTPARTSQKRVASALQRHRTPSSQPRCRSQLSPAHGEIPIAERTAPPQSVPLPAVSSLGGFRTPAAVRVETFVAAGVRKPSQERSLRLRPSGDALDVLLAEEGVRTHDS